MKKSVYWCLKSEFFLGLALSYIVSTLSAGPYICQYVLPVEFVSVLNESLLPRGVWMCDSVCASSLCLANSVPLLVVMGLMYSIYGSSSLYATLSSPLAPFPFGNRAMMEYP